MKNLWDDNEAANYSGDLALRVYSSRLLGRNTALVLHGGGNTSVKIREKNIFGQDCDLLYVKGSGWDLETIEEAGFAPVLIDHLRRLADLETLSDLQMVNELKTHMTVAAAPTPSVETILHAALPYKYVDHTHADAIVTITNAPGGQDKIKNRIRDIYGDSVVIVPYIMPGFDLARLVAREFPRQRTDNTIGMVLLNHGIFSFADTAKESYDRMIALVSKAEDYLKAHKAWALPQYSVEIKETVLRHSLAQLRNDISTVAGFPVIMHTQHDARSLGFIRRADITDISQQGPATPDHVIRTKPLPMLGRDAESYVQSYKRYFDTYAPNARGEKTMLDPAPRVVLDPELGLCAIGRNTKDAAIVKDIYQHTIEVIERSTLLEAYQALPQQDIFDMEYWDLEQAKLKKQGSVPLFNGEVVLITGAASGIGRACVDAFLQRGAAVVGLDINPNIKEVNDRVDYLGIVCDVTDEAQIQSALETVVRNFGGLDMLVLNAGIFPPGCPINELQTTEWRKVMRINLDANLIIMREAFPLLKLAPKGGRVVVMGSKNVPAPGPGAAAYSASKAALNQLARVAALEWGDANIRINSLHPDAVFDTGIWTDEVIAARANYYGLTVEQYKTKNILKTEVQSKDVAALAAELCGPLFAKTTGAQIPLDGGNERVI
jgi:rhamnose utilization protein RhaD (predicted bifunctional aldolase and dehydrogenase)/NAD(P)-dependent dehydrogenase (short-subunit alcohol dehydrogenase family)